MLPGRPIEPSRLLVLAAPHLTPLSPQTARYSKRGSATAERGVLALKGLHRRVLPFVLRRTKEQVLGELPPKILQDVMCEPTPLQKALYKQLEEGQVRQWGM